MSARSAPPSIERQTFTIQKGHIMSNTTELLDTPAAAAERQELFLARIRALVPALRERAAEAEELRRIPDATMDDLLAAGMFRLHTPLRYGGLQLGLRAHVEAARIIAQGCIATAWASSFLTHSANRIAKLDHDLQDRIFGESPDVLSCGTNQYHPGSTLTERADGQWILNGRWSFASGVMNARYVEVSLPNGRTRDGAETRITAMVPRDQVEIVDTWHTLGMRGTGSQDIQFRDVLVPADMVHTYAKRALTVNPGTERYPDFEFLRYPYHQVVWAAHAAYLVGGAEHALEIFRTQIAPKKNRPWGTGPIIDSPITHQKYGEAASKIRTAGLILDAEVALVEETYAAEGSDLTMEQRAYLNMDAVAAIGLCGEAVQLLARMSGGSIHRTGHPLDRIQRDVETLMNHSSGDWSFHSEYAGRVLLGLGLGNRPEELF